MYRTRNICGVAENDAALAVDSARASAATADCGRLRQGKAAAASPEVGDIEQVLCR